MLVCTVYSRAMRTPSEFIVKTTFHECTFFLRFFRDLRYVVQYVSFIQYQIQLESILSIRQHAVERDWRTGKRVFQASVMVKVPLLKPQLWFKS